MLVLDCDGIDVALVPWPDEDEVRAALIRAGCPRLLLIAPAVPVPVVHDALEDWVRRPVDHRELEVRAQRVARIARDGVLAPVDGHAR
jgi:hypothetical protein